MEILKKNSKTLSNISDLSIYRRSVEVGIEPTARRISKNQEAYFFLRSGDINTFNKRRAAESGVLDLTGADLTGAYLANADLANADLANADLAKANLTWVNLTKANLTKASLTGGILAEANLANADLANADLTKADLVKADLVKADLTKANLTGADLTGANLTRANLAGGILVEADLTGADLTGADLSSSLIVHPVYENLLLNADTTFNRAIIDDSEFIDYILRFTKDVPEKIRNKKELTIKLLERISDETIVVDLLSISTLPE